MAPAPSHAGAPPIDVTHSFSVSAWVRLDRITGYQTVASIDGNQVSNFYLQFRDDTRRFAFVRLPSDAAQGAPSFPAATFDPVAGQWYLLTGVFDATARTLSLYVDGRLQDTTPAPDPWTPSGHLVIGRGRFGGNPVDFVQGAIDDVRVYDQALSAPDVAQLATSGTWPLDEGTGTTAADDSLDGHDGTLSAGATWTSGVVGAHAVAFDGTTSVIDTPSPAVDTTQGFSVAAWVRLDSTTGFQTAVSVDGEQVSGFYLQRRGDGRFAFTRLASDSSGAAASFAASSATAQVGQWYHLVGVYDGVARTLTLYVNGNADGQLQLAVEGERPPGHRARQVRRRARRLLRRRHRRRAHLSVPARRPVRRRAGHLRAVALRRGRRHRGARRVARRSRRHAALGIVDERRLGQRGRARRRRRRDHA